MHAHWLAAGAVAATLGKPYVVQVWGTDVALARRVPWLARPVLRRARLVIAASSALADEARALGAREVRVVPSGVRDSGDGGRAGGAAARALRRPALGGEGRARARGGDAATWRSSSSATGRCGRACRRRSASSRPGELGPWYERAAVVAAPSRREGYGVAVREAMAWGRPVVATAVGGLLDAVEDGVTGLLVPPGDVAALRAALERLLGDAELRTRLGAAARERAQRELSFGVAAERLRGGLPRGALVRPGLYLYALRAARARQLRARALRPLARRRFPAGVPPREAQPLPAAEELWRSPAFEPGPPPDPATRLGRFHAEYGEDVLAAARDGDAGAAQARLERWIDGHPPRNDDAWHPYPLSTRVGNWIAALTLLPELASAEVSESLWRQLRRLEANVEDDVLGNHVIRNARALVLGGASFAAPALTRRGIDLLRRELAEQVLPDGGHYERSPVYHLVVLRDLLEVQAVSPHSWLGDAIERMRGSRRRWRAPTEAPALFNDGGLDLAPRLELPAAAGRSRRLRAVRLRRRAGGASVARIPAAGRSRLRSCPRTRTPMRSRFSSGGTATRCSWTRARTRTSRARSATGSAARRHIRRCASTAATSSGSGVRSAAAGCRT